MTSIQKLKLHGFKSFPKSTEIIFPQGYSVVIGSNGSGKSNIMDAFCFVFGKGSAKGMRAEKSANLIYNGGKLGKPMKEAEVSVWFDNKDKAFPLQEKQIKISRIVKQNGQSAYKINDRTRNKQEVLDLLNAARIDPDGHNIILQGDIVKFMELKTEQRREVMEEISGISVYEDKKQRAINDLNKVEERLKEAEIILTERRAHLRELKKDRDQALKYKEIENDIKSNKATYISLQTKNKLESKEEIDKKVKEHELSIGKIQSEIDEFKKIINDKKEEIRQINAEIEKRGEKEQLKIHKEVEELKTSLLKKESRVDICSNEIKRTSLRKQELRKEHDEIENKIKNLKKTVEQYDKNRKSFEQEERSILAEIKDFKQKNNLKNLDEIRDRLDKLNDEKNELLRNKDKIEFELSKFSKGDFKDINKLREEFKSVTLELNNCLKNDDKYIVELGRLRKSLVGKSEEMAKLSMESVNYKQMTFDSIAIKRILESGIKGIHNIVSDLGRVDSRYSLALEVAAGPRLKSIVVDDDKIAQKCISYLKEKKLGVCTFLPLNKMQGTSISSAQNQKGVHGTAFSLVKFDPKYRNIFSYVFGNTLVVDDIDTARNIGIGNVRMVTLSGDLMELSGAMVGGHRKRSGYGFKEMNFDSKIDKLELEISQLKKQVDDYENLKVKNDNNISDMKRNKSELEAQLIKFEKLFDSSINVNELNSNLKQINSRLAVIEREIGVYSNALKSSKDENVKGLDLLEEKRSKLREKMIELDSSNKNFSMQISSMLIPEKEKIISIIRNHDREVHQFNEELDALSKEIKSIGSELKEKEKLEKEFYNEFRSLFNRRNKVQEFIQVKETGLIREEEKIRNAQQRINSINIDRAKIIAEIEALEKEFEPFRNEKIKRNINFDEIKYEIQSLEKEFQKFGNVNLRALEIYEELEKEFEKLTEKHEKLSVERQDVIKMMEEIDSRKADLFMKTFNIVNKRFIENFMSLSDKGQAYMELEDKEKPLEHGVEIKVKLPGNRFMDIKGLSGGEKTMATLAFIFAIQEFQPASFYLLDEVDAALDKHNSMRLSKLIKQYSNRAQYIVISHNDQVITEADQIYGISMQQGISKIVSLKV
ncbi:chromosome segregation protein SMC [Candidatus Woesearchaeota archaeon]|nr:chromosome segregation protein SMC [Candidatus Woesearchaeota archaeon]